MLIPITTRLLWEAFSHAAMTSQRLRSHHSTTDSLWPGQVLIYTAVQSELERCGGNKNAKALEQQQKESEPNAILPRLRAWLSTAEPPVHQAKCRKDDRRLLKHYPNNRLQRYSHLEEEN